jgi:hypothetical protein
LGLKKQCASTKFAIDAAIKRGKYAGRSDQGGFLRDQVRANR